MIKYNAFIKHFKNTQCTKMLYNKKIESTNNTNISK